MIVGRKYIAAPRLDRFDFFKGRAGIGDDMRKIFHFGNLAKN
jgi:hypothetical protein